MTPSSIFFVAISYVPFRILMALFAWECSPNGHSVTNYLGSSNVVCSSWAARIPCMSYIAVRVFAGLHPASAPLSAHQAFAPCHLQMDSIHLCKQQVYALSEEHHAEANIKLSSIIFSSAGSRRGLYELHWDKIIYLPQSCMQCPEYTTKKMSRKQNSVS